jgi:hypothetical protein
MADFHVRRDKAALFQWVPRPHARRRRARPRIKLLHLLRPRQPRPHRAQPGGPAGVHDAIRLPARPAGLVVDHIIPLKRGGADEPWNMQWQTIAAGKAKEVIRLQMKLPMGHPEAPE